MTARNKVLATAAAAGCTLLSAAGITGSGVTAGAPGTGRPADHPSALAAGHPKPAGHPTPTGHPASSRPATSAGFPRPPTSAECVKQLGIGCYSPLQVQRAYDLQPLYARHLDGTGRTIVIVDPFGSPTLSHDLRVFDSGFGLPAPPSLQVLQPVGRVPPYNPKNPDMVQAAGETTVDVEAAHEIAPGASIVVLETPVAETLSGGGFAQFMAAENYAVVHNLGDVISQSFGIPEQNFPSRAALLGLRYAFVNAYQHKVTVLAASNDFGVTGPTPAGVLRTQRIVDWPASDPLVTGVGGTTLHLTATGQRTSPDTAWNESGNATVARYAGALPWATSGGVSAVFTRPAYQDPVRGAVGNRRGVPDVALCGSFSGGVATFESFTGAPGYWRPGGGTSVATPELAGLVAIADQYSGARLGLLNPALYRLEQTHGPGLVDVTSGSNTVSFGLNGKSVTVPGYSAGPGYDLVTGVGTIDAARFVLNRAAPATGAPAGDSG
jgi:subtilase family serine protease